jgi:hypothetical protein
MNQRLQQERMLLNKKQDTKDETSKAQLPKNVDGAMTTIGMR